MPGNGQALLGMPDIETPNILTIKCNTKDMQTKRKQIHSEMEDEQLYTNNMQETAKPESAI